jgi:hypothetical protein
VCKYSDDTSERTSERTDDRTDDRTGKIGDHMDRDRLIDFEWAEVVTPMIYPPKPRLVVRGLKPHPDMEVSLVPLAYVSQPPYYGIQVVGAMTVDGPHVSQPITAIPYYVELDLQGLGGSEGVEVVGDTRTERIQVPTGAPVVPTTLPAETSGQAAAEATATDG